MRIICCYNDEVHPLTRKAIEKFAPETEFVETPGLFGYNEAIASRWTGESDLVVIEGDKEIHADVIPSFQVCDEPWCTFEYDNFPPPYQRSCQVGLGCAKFSADCQILLPTETFTGPDNPIGWKCTDCGGKGCWRYLDTRIALGILSRCIAFAPHVHGRIEHHHEYDPDWPKNEGWYEAYPELAPATTD
jgi:hypothetical protein